MTHVLLVNGPPRSGKDTLGQIVADLVTDAQVVKMAHALKVGTHCLFRAMANDLTPVTLAHSMQDDLFEDAKESPMPMFMDLTPREAYIAVSERLFKPLFGEEVFGMILADNMKRQPGVPLWVVTDSGFAPEAQPIIRTFGADNCTLVRMHRDGCDFAADSRSYIELPDVHTIDLHNNGALKDLVYQARTEVLPAFV